MKNWEGEKGGKSQIPSFTGLCINYWTTPLYTHPTWSPSPEWSQKHQLVSFPNLSKSCLFQHLLKDETECPAVITKASGISIIILITGAWLKQHYLNHKRPRPQLDHELLYSLMLHRAACMSSVQRKLKNWHKHQASIQHANCWMLPCKEVPAGFAHGPVMLFLKDTWALFNPPLFDICENLHTVPGHHCFSERIHLFLKQLGSAWSALRACFKLAAEATVVLWCSHNHTHAQLRCGVASILTALGFEAALCFAHLKEQDVIFALHTFSRKRCRVNSEAAKQESRHLLVVGL